MGCEEKGTVGGKAVREWRGVRGRAVRRSMERGMV